MDDILEPECHEGQAQSGKKRLKMRNKILVGLSFLILAALFFSCPVDVPEPTYTVIYDSNYGEGNSGEGIMANSFFTYGKSHNLSACTYENLGKDGYRFAGWALA